jgi:hypothetical protein
MFAQGLQMALKDFDLAFESFELALAWVVVCG